MATLIGNDVMLWVKDSSNGTYNSIAGATNCTLDINQDILEVASKDNGQWIENIAGNLSWSMSSEALFTLTPANASQHTLPDLYDLMKNHTQIYVTFGTINTGANVTVDFDNGINEDEDWSPSATYQRAGTAYISELSLNGGDGEIATFSITLTGVGALS